MKNSINFLNKIVSWKNDLLHLIFPSTCLICENELSKFEESLCSFCQQELKYTHFEDYKIETSLDKLFWGRVNVKTTFSMLYFEKGNHTQTILHQIKYKSNLVLGKFMGEKMGEKLKMNTKYENIDVLIPIPLHPKKKYIRGYNQSEIIANGISKSLNIPLNLTFLIRIKHAESQTKKSKFLRWDNIEEAFYVNVKGNENLKHIALIDDVITTGSTIESCIQKIHNLRPDIEISVFSLAVTK
jgi:competence protein ComFC